MSRPMSRAFLKMNGLGNDFVVVQGAEDFQPTPDQVRAWGDRASGIGFDQLIAISRDDQATPLVRFWNSDGEEVGACGNGSRCVGWLLMQASGKASAAFHTAERALSATAAGTNRVSVDMGEPRLRWDEIPLAEDMDTRNIELQIGPIDNPRLHTPGAVSMGNPHVVFFVDEEPSDEQVTRDGSMIEHHPLFPQAVNVGFAQVLSPDRIRLRVWERGAGLTLACGTGACAALVATARRGLTGRSASILVDGGELHVEWREADNHVIMTGDVAVEFSGTLP
jgi:diaminopimelate epimerase